MPPLFNRAEANGLYDGVTIDNYSELYVKLSALDITKTANKEMWLDDDLEYTITVTNSAVGIPIDTIEVTDNIDISHVILDEGSLTLTVEGTPVIPVNYTYVNGLLTVSVGTLAAGETAVITFSVGFAP